MMDRQFAKIEFGPPYRIWRMAGRFRDEEGNAFGIQASGANEENLYRFRELVESGAFQVRVAVIPGREKDAEWLNAPMDLDDMQDPEAIDTDSAWGELDVGISIAPIEVHLSSPYTVRYEIDPWIYPNTESPFFVDFADPVSADVRCETNAGVVAFSLFEMNTYWSASLESVVNEMQIPSDMWETFHPPSQHTGNWRVVVKAVDVKSKFTLKYETITVA